MSTAWVTSLSRKNIINWQICKETKLWGTGSLQGRNVKAGDTLFIWQTGSPGNRGWLAECRVTQDAQPVIEDQELPWPDERPYRYIFSFDVLSEADPPLELSFENKLQDGTGIHQRLLGWSKIDEVQTAYLESLFAESDPIVQWINKVSATRRFSQDGEESFHQPATLLWFLSQFAAAQPRLRRWSQFRELLTSVLNTAGGGPTPQYPLVALSRSGVLESVGVNPDLTAHGNVASDLNREDPLFGLPNEIYVALGQDPDRMEPVILEIGRLITSLTARKDVFQSCGIEIDIDPLLGKPIKKNSHTSPPQRESLTSGNPNPQRTNTTSSAIVRDAHLVSQIKAIHDNRCQRCGIRLDTPTGAISQVAHIKGLGEPHNGPDIPENVLCLCPNCHSTFDKGSWFVRSKDLVCVDRMSGEEVQLEMDPNHPIDLVYLDYQANSI